MTIDTKHIYTCDFCDKPQEPEQLFMGLRDSHICNRCVVSFRENLAQQNAAEAAGPKAVGPEILDSVPLTARELHLVDTAMSGVMCELRRTGVI